MNSRIFLAISVLLIGAFSCNENQLVKDDEGSLSVLDKEAYMLKGKAVAKATFNTLSQTLQSKIKAGGIPEAIDYCNLAALPLTDSIAKANNVLIRRVSTKTRNQSNRPSAHEESVIAQYSEEIEQGRKAVAQIEVVGSDVYFTAPIIVKPLCLNCHGTPGEELAFSNYNLIKAKYPKDQAINYGEGDLRGIWSIQFKQ